MRIEVNGSAREVPPATTLAALLGVLGLRAESVAVERNGRLVPRTEHARTTLEEGDRVEVVTLVGGG